MLYIIEIITMMIDTIDTNVLYATNTLPNSWTEQITWLVSVCMTSNAE